MEEKKIVYVDMDGVLVDFEKSIQETKNRSDYVYSTKHENNPDLIPNIFINAKPIEGAIEAIDKLQKSGKYELYIATTSPWDNPIALGEKLQWVKKWVGEYFIKKVITTHRKDLLMGDYLIDDRTKRGAGEFKGELIRFGWDYENKKWNEYPDWDSVLEKLL